MGQTVPLTSAARGALYIGIFLDLLGFGMIIPDIQFRAEKLGAPGWVIGALLASTFVVQFFVSPLWGKASDWRGAKLVLSVCTALSATGMLIYGLSNTLLVLLASRLISGMGGANVAIAQAMLGGAAEDSSRAAHLGRLSAAVSGGLVFGPALGGYLAGELHLNVGIVAASASATGLLLLLAFIPATAGATPAEKKRLVLDFSLLKEIPAVRALALLAVVAWFSLATLEGTFGRLLKTTLHFGQTEFGIIFAYESALMFVVQAFALSWLVRHSSEQRLLRLAYLMQALGLVLPPFVFLLPFRVSYFGDLGLLLFCSSLYALGAAVANPTINSLCSGLTPKHKQGELFGLLQGARSVGFVVGPIVGGFLFDQWYAAPYVLAAAVCVLVSVKVSATLAALPSERSLENQI